MCIGTTATNHLPTIHPPSPAHPPPSTTTTTALRRSTWGSRRDLRRPRWTPRWRRSTSTGRYPEAIRLPSRKTSARSSPTVSSPPKGWRLTCRISSRSPGTTRLDTTSTQRRTTTRTAPRMTRGTFTWTTTRRSERPAQTPPCDTSSCSRSGSSRWSPRTRFSATTTFPGGAGCPTRGRAWAWG